MFACASAFHVIVAVGRCEIFVAATRVAFKLKPLKTRNKHLPSIMFVLCIVLVLMCFDEKTKSYLEIAPALFTVDEVAAWRSAPTH